MAWNTFSEAELTCYSWILSVSLPNYYGYFIDYYNNELIIVNKTTKHLLINMTYKSKSKIANRGIAFIFCIEKYKTSRLQASINKENTDF